MNKWLKEYESCYLWSSGEINERLHLSIRLFLLPFYVCYIMYHCIKGTNIKITIYK